MVTHYLSKIAIWIVFLFIFFATPALGQIGQTVDVTKAIVEESEWSEGTVFLKNGNQLVGLLRLNTKTGLLAFESGATSKTFNPRTAIGFEFFDAVQVKKRSFISADYENPTPPKNNPFSSEKGTQLAAKVPQFFELLMEFSSFVLLSTFSQVQIESKTIYPYNNGVTSQNTMIDPSTTYSQSETIFIMDQNQKLLPVLQVTNREVDSWLIDSKKSKSKNIDDENVLETFTAPHFHELEKYAKENKLSFKKKVDLFKILEYYKTLTAN
jgi:hypothetical protein